MLRNQIRLMGKRCLSFSAAALLVCTSFSSATLAKQQQRKCFSEEKTCTGKCNFPMGSAAQLKCTNACADKYDNCVAVGGNPDTHGASHPPPIGAKPVSGIGSGAGQAPTRGGSGSGTTKAGNSPPATASPTGSKH